MQKRTHITLFSMLMEEISLFSIFMVKISLFNIYMEKIRQFTTQKQFLEVDLKTIRIFTSNKPPKNPVRNDYWWILTIISYICSTEYIIPDVFSDDISSVRYVEIKEIIDDVSHSSLWLRFDRKKKKKREKICREIHKEIDERWCRRVGKKQQHTAFYIRLFSLSLSLCFHGSIIVYI